MAKTRVHELAKTYGIESKEVLDKLKELGEFVKSASSTIELPVEMKFKKTYGDALLAAKAPAAPAERPAETPAAEKTAASTVESNGAISVDESPAAAKPGPRQAAPVPAESDIPAVQTEPPAQPEAPGAQTATPASPSPPAVSI